jgi:hypothetical protein
LVTAVHVVVESDTQLFAVATRFIKTTDLETIEDFDDPFVNASLQSIHQLGIASVESEVHRLLNAVFLPMDVPKHIQHNLPASLDAIIAKTMRTTMSQAALVRYWSSSVPNANAWLCPLPGDIEPFWLKPAEFIVLVRFRFGLPLSFETPPS